MIKYVLRNMWRRKARTILTVLGIVIGIMTLTVLGAMAARMNQQAKGAVEWFGDNINVYSEGGGIFGGGGYFERNKVEEIEAVPGVEDTNAALTFGLENRQGFGFPEMVHGTDLSKSCQRLECLKLAEGRLIREGDSGEVVLGSTIANELGAEVGEEVELDGTPFEVVGIFEVTLTSPDAMAFMSLDDAQDLLRASYPVFDIGDVVDSIYVYADPGVDDETLAERIEERVEGMDAVTPVEMESRISSFTVIFNAIVLGVGLIALIVGGLSIINTMIMSVSERTREIGLKKAIGADTRSILGEILLEAAAIGMSGGFMGMGLGVVLVAVLNGLTSSQGVTIFSLTPAVIVGPVIFATVLGALAGLIPALRAARLNPVKALREV
ncbi:MAG: ABC transporter permease [Actinomycetota bacterium]